MRRSAFPPRVDRFKTTFGAGECFFINIPACPGIVRTTNAASAFAIQERGSQKRLRKIFPHGHRIVHGDEMVFMRTDERLLLQHVDRVVAEYLLFGRYSKSIGNSLYGGIDKCGRMNVFSTTIKIAQEPIRKKCPAKLIMMWLFCARSCASSPFFKTRAAY